jgi:purine-binding chemotaxis protein CheW
MRQTEAGLDLLVFRVGTELFALDVTAVHEVVELSELREAADGWGALAGVLEWRGHVAPVYALAPVLGFACPSRPAVALILAAGEGRIGLGIDDVEDMVAFDLAAVRRLPLRRSGVAVLGVARWKKDVVTLLDGEALAAACLCRTTTEKV